MSKETKLFKSKVQKNRNEISDQLHLIADKIRSGQLNLEQEGNQLTLAFPEDLTLEIELEDKLKKQGTRHCLQIEIKWYDGGVAQPLQIT